MEGVGANSAATATALDPLPSKSNYFIGSDPSQWRTDVANYGRVKYQNVYTGVDLIYYGDNGQLKFDFVLAAGADPNQIALAYQGADSIALDAEGNLILHTANGDIVQQKPVIYQDINGVRQAVSGGYALLDGNQVGFQVAAYDPSKLLVIDPTVSFFTSLGVFGHQSDLAVDPSGNSYVTGFSDPATVFTPGEISVIGSAAEPVAYAFVAKLSPNGDLIYRTFVGGSEIWTVGLGIAANTSGEVYVTGVTENLYDRIDDAFVFKLNAQGNSLLFWKILGGNRCDHGADIAIDSDDSAYITGYTDSVDHPDTPEYEGFPLKSALQANPSGAFATKLNASGELVYSTYLPISTPVFNASGTGIALDAARNAYVTGWERPYMSSSRYDGEVFVMKLAADGSGVALYKTFGGLSFDFGTGIAVDQDYFIYVLGVSHSDDFPTTSNAYQQTFNGPWFEGGTGTDKFLAKFDPAGNPVYVTYLGGSDYDPTQSLILTGGLAVDNHGNVYVTGHTSSTDFPLTQDALQSDGGGSSLFSVFLTKIDTRLSSPDSLAFSTYLEGYVGEGIAVDPEGSVYVLAQNLMGGYVVKICDSPLTLGLDDVGTEISADNPESFIGAVVVVGTDMEGNPIFADDGTTIEWRVVGDGGTLKDLVTTTSFGFSSNVLHTTRRAGDTFQVFAKITHLIVDGEIVDAPSCEVSTPILTVHPGAAAYFTFAVSDNRIPADEHTQTTVTLTAYDAWGNLIADGSEVTWNLEGVGDFLLIDDATINGIARATVQAGWTAGTTKISATIDSLTEGTEIENLPLNITLSVSDSELVIGSGEMVTLTAFVTDADGVPVPDGTPIAWFTQKGSIAGDLITHTEVIGGARILLHRLQVYAARALKKLGYESPPPVKVALIAVLLVAGATWATWLVLSKKTRSKNGSK